MQIRGMNPQMMQRPGQNQMIIQQGQRIIQPLIVNGQGRPPGVPIRHPDPFQRRTPQGTGAREVRSISPAVSTPPSSAAGSTQSATGTVRNFCVEYKLYINIISLLKITGITC
jgi:hypothetical protein